MVMILQIATWIAIYIVLGLISYEAFGAGDIEAVINDFDAMTEDQRQQVIRTLRREFVTKWPFWLVMYFVAKKQIQNMK